MFVKLMYYGDRSLEPLINLDAVEFIVPEIDSFDSDGETQYRIFFRSGQSFLVSWKDWYFLESILENEDRILEKGWAWVPMTTEKGVTLLSVVLEGQLVNMCKSTWLDDWDKSGRFCHFFVDEWDANEVARKLENEG